MLEDFFTLFQWYCTVKGYLRREAPAGPVRLCNRVCTQQCFGSAWIRIKFVSWIRIRIPNADPDPAADKISPKSQNNSYHLELFD
jgi:hypothetical protein